jgi:hypothetical protein
MYYVNEFLRFLAEYLMPFCGENLVTLNQTTMSKIILAVVPIILILIIYAGSPSRSMSAKHINLGYWMNTEREILKSIQI